MSVLSNNDQYYMRAALNEARRAVAEGEIPVGAVITDAEGHIIASAHNMTQALNDVTAHAEMLAITAAASHFGAKYLTDCTLYVTVEPCLMCAGALAWSQIGRIVIGAKDDKRGYRVQTSVNPFHPKTVVEYGLMAEECADMMVQFFKQRRKL